MDEKKVLGKIIDLWGAGDEKDPYAKSTEANLISRAEKDELSREQALEVLKSLEEKGLILRDEEKGETHINYQVGAAQIVKELQKTAFVYGTTEFKPPHH
jgi:hypothetical protein